MNFSGTFGSASTIWYPASGCRIEPGGVRNVSIYGDYWSATPSSDYFANACYLFFSNKGTVGHSGGINRGHCCAVRCIKEID